MASAPKFTVLLPTHNRCDVVGGSITSILNQTERDFELFVIGDGCTDDTAAVVQGFDDPRIRWFDLPKAPFYGYANRNIGLKEATGDLIAYAAHDDLYFPDHLALMAQKFERDDCQICYSRPLWITDDGQSFPSFVNLMTARMMRRFMAGENVLPSTTVAHRRACFDALGYWPEDVEKAGDHDLWTRILKSYGRTALGFVRAPSTFHFRAERKPDANWMQGPVNFLESLADIRGEWPAAMCFEVSDGAELQHSVLEQLKPGKIRRLRNAVVDLGDELAWEIGMQQAFSRR